MRKVEEEQKAEKAARLKEAFCGNNGAFYNALKEYLPRNPMVRKLVGCFGPLEDYESTQSKIKRVAQDELGVEQTSAKKFKLDVDIVKRTAAGAVLLKEELDQWGRTVDYFEEESVGTTVISNTVYYSSYDLPEPVDMQNYKC